MAYKRGTPERRSLKGTKKRMIVKSTFPEVRMDGVMPTEEELKDFEVSNNQLKSIFCARQDKHQKRCGFADGKHFSHKAPQDNHRSRQCVENH